MKLAICFYGQLRNIRNPCVVSSYLNLINQYDVDFYCHSWKYADGEPLNISSWVPAVNQSVGAEKFILETYKPRVYSFDIPIDSSLSVASRSLAETMSDYSPNNEKALLSHLKSVTEVTRLIENSDQYDFVLLTRYDVHIYNMPNLHTMQKKFYITDKRNQWWCDSCQLFSPNFLKAFDIFENIDSLLKKISDSQTRWFVAELFKKHSFTKHYDMSDVVFTKDLWTGIVRNENCLENVLI